MLSVSVVLTFECSVSRLSLLLWCPSVFCYLYSNKELIRF